MKCDVSLLTGTPPSRSTPANDGAATTTISRALLARASCRMSAGSCSEPKWVLRQHMPNAVHDVSWYAPHRAGEPGAEPADLWLAAGDASGQVSITWLPTYRPRALWKAHDDAVLGVEMVDSDTVMTCVLALLKGRLPY